MDKKQKVKCVLVLTEGASDRNALSGFIQKLYELIDPSIQVYFPVLCDSISDKEGRTVPCYDGDITSRRGVNEDNIAGLVMKMYIHPEIKKHVELDTPGAIIEIIHLVDTDGAFINKRNVISASSDYAGKLPFYDVENNTIVAHDRKSIIERNSRKRANLDKLSRIKKLEISLSESSKESRKKPYSVYYFSSNLDHVLHGEANLPSKSKIPRANSFANEHDDWKDMARLFLNHSCAVNTMNYQESWEILMNSNTLAPMTNINLLIADLLKRAKVKL